MWRSVRIPVKGARIFCRSRASVLPGPVTAIAMFPRATTVICTGVAAIESAAAVSLVADPLLPVLAGSFPCEHEEKAASPSMALAVRIARRTDLLKEFPIGCSWLPPDGSEQLHLRTPGSR